MKKLLLLAAAFLVTAGVIVSQPNLWKSWFEVPLTRDEASSALRNLTPGIDRIDAPVIRRAKLSLGNKADLKSTLPAITEFPLSVRGATSGNVVHAEIFASSEKAGQGTDGWINEVAKQFNQARVKLADGREASVSIRKIASGTGYQFIASGEHTPAAFSPSNHLWIAMAKAHGAQVAPVSERLVGNSAGIVLRAGSAAAMRERYGELNVRNLLDAVVQGHLVMGYTDPFASSTGLNFLVTVLAEFAGGDQEAMLSDAVVSSFESFQQGVPFVALTTLQMRESVQNEGSLDAFVMEYQTFVKTPELSSGYEFIAFGLLHDNPLYFTGEDTAQKAVIEAFAQFAAQDKFVQLASEYGFNAGPRHQSAYALPDGATLIKAQRLWKEKKDSGRPIAAVFLCDVSGSMRGTRLANLRKALTAGAEFIASENSIGLVAFNNSVTTLLPIKRFNLPHKANFVAAVDALRAGGNTAMYDGVAISLSMLDEAVRATPDAKPILFVLSEGATNRGLEYGDLAPIAAGLQIPIYTIGYAAKLSELKRLSSLVEAASLNADEAQIEYKIGALLNAQM